MRLSLSQVASQSKGTIKWASQAYMYIIFVFSIL